MLISLIFTSKFWRDAFSCWRALLPEKSSLSCNFLVMVSQLAINPPPLSCLSALSSWNVPHLEVGNQNQYRRKTALDGHVPVWCLPHVKPGEVCGFVVGLGVEGWVGFMAEFRLRLEVQKLSHLFLFLFPWKLKPSPTQVEWGVLK